jgi:hypothetical protein
MTLKKTRDVSCLFHRGANVLKPQEESMRKKGGNTELAVTGKPMPLTPRKAYLNRTERSLQPTQAEQARKVFASRGLIAKPRSGKEQALADLGVPISPRSVGLGRRRKTKRSAKKMRRATRKRL